MVKNYLNKKILVLFLFLITIISYPKESYSNLYIKITDINNLIESGKKEKAETLMKEFENEFKGVNNVDSPKGKELQKELEEKVELDSNKMARIAKLLLEFDKEQNPENLEESKNKFVAKVIPALDKFEGIIKKQNLDDIRQEYVNFNNIWTRNEAFIRDKDIAYYGKVEMALSLLRAVIETTPTNYESISVSFSDLRKSINDYLEGKVVDEKVEEISLSEAINILKKASEDYKNGNAAKAAKSIKKFISIWPSVEGEIRTRNSSLYTNVETNLPIILAKSDVSSLDNLINELSQIDTKAEYSFFDAMFILLREGLEALVIVMALVSSMKAMNNKKGTKYVYLGAIFGVFLSFIVAGILQVIFPSVSSGVNREILESGVGILAVFVMLFVGAWLHSKSNIKAWNNYMNREIRNAVGSGSILSMFTLSFLAVFREGAETILFYVGIIPLISLKNLTIGIVLAIVILLIIAIIILKAGEKFKVYQIFYILTWLIYFLAFKMLGVSIHMLQVVGYLPIHVVRFIPTIEILGIYANYEVLITQILLIIIIYTLAKKVNKN
ncbi:FTR1 family protein [Pseudostreptobacillus hongkongensis]|uniref:FTR1 family iron permease n=1 Tax=Pseudostreptobacillus hongkongensis TaxID=1162717 RepID=UPI0028D23CF4|nr:FTR1 family protein [Pseudostreptobacillus hongkongensis]